MPQTKYQRQLTRYATRRAAIIAMRATVNKRTGKRPTYAVIGKRFGISKARVMQIVNEAELQASIFDCSEPLSRFR